jgi:hypothetical protein
MSIRQRSLIPCKIILILQNHPQKYTQKYTRKNTHKITIYQIKKAAVHAAVHQKQFWIIF